MADAGPQGLRTSHGPQETSMIGRLLSPSSFEPRPRSDAAASPAMAARVRAAASSATKGPR